MCHLNQSQHFILITCLFFVEDVIVMANNIFLSEEILDEMDSQAEEIENHARKIKQYTQQARKTKADHDFLAVLKYFKVLYFYWV